MPELPEVETVRRGLERLVVGERLVSVEVTGTRSVRRQDPGEFARLLLERTVVAARRRGKFLVLPLDDQAVLVAHLRMSGQLVYLPDPGASLALHTHVRIGLGSGGELRFVDPRTFGELFVTAELGSDGLPLALSGLGTDPLNDGVDEALLSRLCAKSRRPLKALLLDQAKICGIGNIYADEICFAARLSPSKPAGSLKRAERVRLAGAISEVLASAICHRGSSLRDGRYTDLEGTTGDFQLLHAVYGRAGLACPRCKGVVVATRIVGRSAHYCPGCQR